MLEHGYTTVAEEYQGRQRCCGQKKQTRLPEKGDFTPQERCRWGRLLICAVVFFALVLVKINVPERFQALSKAASEYVGQSVDYRAVFGAVGKAVRGESTVKETVNDVYMEVFHPDQSAGKAVETAVRVELSDGGRREDPLLPEDVYGTCLMDGEGGFPAVESEKPTEVPKKETVVEETPKPEKAAEKPVASQNVSKDPPLPKGVSMERKKLKLSGTVPVSGWVSSPYGYREHPINGEQKFHKGLDIAAPEGSTVGAFADGTVKAVGESTSLGKYIMVSHADDITTIYAHCSKITATGGKKVKKGEKIAEVGHTGMATGPHLHFAMQQHGVYLNPGYYVKLDEKKK